MSPKSPLQTYFPAIWRVVFRLSPERREGGPRGVGSTHLQFFFFSNEFIQTVFNKYIMKTRLIFLQYIFMFSEAVKNVIKRTVMTDFWGSFLAFYYKGTVAKDLCFTII